MVTTGDTPYSLWFGQKPDLTHLRIFGSPAYSVLPLKTIHNKLKPRATLMCFVGYGDRFGVKAYHLYDANGRSFHFSRAASSSMKAVYPQHLMRRQSCLHPGKPRHTISVSKLQFSKRCHPSTNPPCTLILKQHSRQPHTWPPPMQLTSTRAMHHL